MKISDEMLEIAARAAYENHRSLAHKYHAGTQLERFVPWDQISKEWRDDFASNIRAAIEKIPEKE